MQSRGVADIAGKPDHGPIVVIENVERAQGVGDRGAQLRGQCQHVGFGIATANAAKQGNPFPFLQYFRGFLQLRQRRRHRGQGVYQWVCVVLTHNVAGEDIGGDLHPGHHPLRQCLLRGYFYHTGNLRRCLDDCLVGADIVEYLGEVHFLVKIAAALCRRHLPRDRNDRSAFFLCVVQAVDQVQCARPGGTGTDTDTTGQL